TRRWSGTSTTARDTIAATPSTRRSCASSAGRRTAHGRTASARQSTGTATTATGGSRSSAPTASATSTSGSTPRAWRSSWLAVLLRLLAQAVDRGLVPLDRLCLVEEIEHSVAVAELEARVREVVLRVRLVERPGAVELLHRLLEEGQSAGEVAGLHL